MIRFLLLPLLISSSVSAATTKFEFHNNDTHYLAERSNTELSFNDRFGPRHLQIKPCNQKLVDRFWSDLTANVKAVSAHGSTKKTPTSWIKFEGIQFRVLKFEPVIAYFNKLPIESTALVTESQKLCGKK